MQIQIEQKFRKINICFCTFITVFSLLLVIYYLSVNNTYRLVLCIFSPVLLFIPTVINKFFHLQSVQRLNFLGYCYIFLTYTIGMGLATYQTSNYYDKIMHTLSGTIFSVFGLLLYYYLKPDKKIVKQEFAIASIFATSFSIAVAVIWEIYEYFLFVFFNIDAQNTLSTGVNDTMQDVIVCLIGALLFLIPLWRDYKNDKQGIFMGAITYFCQINIYKK